jgi:inward rectifier potassium channel
MATLRKINSRAKSTIETGFGTNSAYNGGRFFNKDGEPNLKVRGIGFLRRISLYRLLQKMPVSKFIIVILLFYFAINLTFTAIYLSLGPNNLGGVDATGALTPFWEAFFFSAQTISTVGYGHIYPIGFYTNAFAGLESLLGLLAFAFATAIIYGRFAQPRAYLLFSHHALIAPFQGGTAVMFRVAPYKHNNLTDAEVKVSLAMKLKEDGTVTNKFYNLSLEIQRVNSLTLSWTVVHPINDLSPFYNLNKQDLLDANAEILVFLKAFDENFSNSVIARTSYTADEIIEGGKFKIMYHPTEDNKSTILDINLLNDYDNVTLPEPPPAN